MKAKRTMHVLTNTKGAIVGGGILAPGKDHKGKPVHIQIEPMRGQSLKEVAVPAELARVEGAEFFSRLMCDFHLPRGKKELVRKETTR
ncbi:MAG: hypothetical protein GDA68_21635 [Nitrospira sp. CR2.1]|nr:hypothetical protein [Nitrospira sp. CR2.1]MBA5873000.1 hypothetical protein [Nitrospira sp. CR1.2]